MKSEPWRGDKATRLLHLENKLAEKKKEITRLAKENAELKEQIEKLRDELEVCEDDLIVAYLYGRDRGEDIIAKLKRELAYYEDGGCAFCFYINEKGGCDFSNECTSGNRQGYTPYWDKEA